MGVILDTSVLIGWERKAASLEAYAAGHPDEPAGLSVIIGATAVSRGDTVLTLNRRDFGKIPGLSVELL